MDNGSEEERKKPDSDIEIQVAKALLALRGHGRCQDSACAGCAGCKVRETTIPKRISRRPPAIHQRRKLHGRKPSLADPLAKRYTYRQTFFSATPSLPSMKRKDDDASDEQTDNDSESEDTPKVKRFLTEKKMKKMGLRRKRMKQ